MRSALQPISLRISSWRSSGADVEGGAERAEVVVVADAVERHAAAVEQEAVVGGELDGAEAEGRFVCVDDLAALLGRW